MDANFIPQVFWSYPISDEAAAKVTTYLRQGCPAVQVIMPTKERNVKSLIISIRAGIEINAMGEKFVIKSFRTERAFSGNEQFLVAYDQSQEATPLETAQDILNREA